MNKAFSTVSDAAGKILDKINNLRVVEDVMLEVFRTSVFVFMTMTLAAGGYVAVFMA